MINKTVLKAFKLAEIKFRRGSGEACMDFALNYVLKRYWFLWPFKMYFKKYMQKQFKKHSDYINSMIIRERIKI